MKQGQRLLCGIDMGRHLAEISTETRIRHGPREIVEQVFQLSH
jgi:hypothetical protein